MTTQHKTCTGCGDTKPLDEYHKHKKRKDGRKSQCKECVLEYSRAYREINRNEIAKKGQIYYTARREQILERGRIYRETNKEQISARRRAKYQQDPEVDKARTRTYRQNNREYVKKYNREASREATLLSQITATRNGRTWEKWEDDFIAAHPEMTTYQLATHLGRTHAGVAYRRRRESAASV